MCPIASGNWNNSANAGVWTLNLNNVRGNSNNNVGCRADSVSRLERRRAMVEPREMLSGAARTVFIASAKSVGLHISSSASLVGTLTGRERQVQHRWVS